MPITIYGGEEAPVTLKLIDVDMSIREGFENIDLINACNYECIKLKNVNVSNFKGECIVRKWSDGDVMFSNVNAGEAEKILPANKPFFTESI